MTVDETLKQKLLGRLTPEEAALLHWLADECGIRSDDPLFSLLIAMHHYETLLKTVPQDLTSAIDTALNKTLTVSGTMQSQLESMHTRHLQQLEAERQHWQQHLTTVTQQLSAVQASNQQLKQAVDQATPVQTTLSKTVKQAQRQWAANTAQPGQTEQHLWVALATHALVAIIASVGWFWIGHQELAGTAQTQSVSQTIGETAQFWQWNRERLALCQKDKNPKCTLWITPPTVAKQP